MYFCPTCNEARAKKDVALKTGTESYLIYRGKELVREYPLCCRKCQSVVSEK